MAMCFGTKYTLNRVPELQIASGGSKITIVDEMKYLGMILDPTLSFTNHVDYIRNKAASRLRMLGQTRALVSQETSLSLYKALISPLFDYAAPVYDCLTKQDTYKLQKVQNCALRIVTKSGKMEHISDMHTRLNMHYLIDRRHISTLCHTYKCLNNLAPQTNSAMLTINTQREIRTRASMKNMPILPAYKLECTRKSFRYRATLYWSLIEQNIRDAGSLAIFKGLLYNSDTFAP